METERRGGRQREGESQREGEGDRERERDRERGRETERWGEREEKYLACYSIYIEYVCIYVHQMLSEGAELQYLYAFASQVFVLKERLCHR